MPMAEETQIEAAARNLLRRYGGDALREADLRVRELEQHSQTQATEFWQAVQFALRRLMQMRDRSER